MDPAKEILFEVLRLGLIAIRNLSESPWWVRGRRERLRQWAVLCHTLPVVIQSDGDNRALRYFLEGDLRLFCRDYPRQDDPGYRQIVDLRSELEAVLGGSSD